MLLNERIPVAMSKRVMIIAFTTILLAIVCLMIWSGLSQSPLKKGNGDSDIENVEPPILKDAVLLERIQYDRGAKAEEILIELSSRQDAVGYYANVALGDRYFDMGKNSVPYYRKALELYDTRDIRLKLADSLAKQGNTTEAAKTYGKALYDKGALASLLGLKLEPEIIGQIMLDENQLQMAVDYLKAEIEKQQDMSRKPGLYKLYGRALAGQGKYNEAIPAFELGLVLADSESELKWWYARSLEGANQINKAKEIYKNLGERGAYRLGFLLEKEGDLKGAAAAYTMSKDADSLWKAACIWDELGNYEKAFDNYFKLSIEQGIYQDDAAYRAYVLIMRNKSLGTDKAKQLMDIISSIPAWMNRLNNEPVWPELKDVSYSKPEFLERVEAYKNSGRKTMALIEQSIGERNADLPAKLALGDWYLEQGNNAQAVVWGMRALREQPCRRAYELAYQMPFNDEVQRASAEFKVDPFLIYALMREESYYQKDAVSRVGALGLMQLMPDTAKDIASRLKVTYNQQELLPPSTNIRFGTFYLGSMLDMFSGDVDKALASYNGGAGNVMRWSKTRLGNTKEGFPASITFQETREYITKVGNSYYIYKWLYGKK